MGRLLRFVVALVLGLAGLTAIAAALVSRTTRGWFERDLSLRAQLAVNSTQGALSEHWRRGELEGLKAVLSDVARDERIMSAAACSGEGKLLAATADFPSSLGCSSLASRSAAEPGGAWSSMTSLPGGSVHVTTVPLLSGKDALGFAVLVQDLSFAERREATSRNFLLLAFAVLAAAASILTVIAARLSWRNWSAQLRDMLQGRGGGAAYQPLLREVREVIQRLSVRTTEPEGNWNAERLRHVLSTHLHGEKLVIVSNREPYIHERGDQGVKVLHPASGLVTALEPVMRACGGTWVAHGSGSADREVCDARARVRVPPGEESYAIRRVWLSPDEEKGYYYGLANEGLWPLCHIADARPAFRAPDWRHYQEINQRFADAVCDEVDGPDPIVLVQDYHLALAPRLIRERLPRATVIAFWHIPWPNSERFGLCPWRAELLEGLLGSSILGFHTQLHCNNFLDAVDRVLEARIDRERDAVVFQGRTCLVRPYPISIDWPNRWAASLPAAEVCRERVLAELGLPPGTLLGVGVDRLDYTKGVEERLLAVERLLERFPRYRGRFTFVQLAAPSRTIIERYRALNDAVEKLADRINAKFASGNYRPVVLLRSHHEPDTVFRFLRAANLCYVSSLHDGMNLVAKEFVAAREDERGVLVLSQFTGAARELTEALVVNPYDTDEASSALATALEMPASEQAERMRALRAQVSEFNVYRWAGRMLVDASRLREQERLSGRLADSTLRAAGVA